MKNNFEKELEQLINKYSMENDSNTPDFILAEYLSNCLKTFNIILQKRAHWYDETGLPISEKVINSLNCFVNEAIMLENAASNFNYHNYCARATLGVYPSFTPYQLLENDYGHVRSASEKEEIRKILKNRNSCCDISKNAYDDWEITMVKTNGCPCGHNGKTISNNSIIQAVRVGDKTYEIGQTVKNNGILEKFTLDGCSRVNATVKYNVNCPFHHYTKFIDIVNL